MKESNSPVSAVILSKNNQKKIGTLISSLSWCSEIIVIDDFSTDSTVDIAKKAGAIVHQHHLNDDFSAQRNVGVKHTTNEWVLFIDSDEVVTEQLQNEIKEAIKVEEVDGYLLKRTDYFLGKVLAYGETAHVTLLRLARKHKGTWKGTVHEEWHITGNIQTLTQPLLHYSHETLYEFIQDINTYSTLVAKQRFNTEHVSWWQIIAYPVGKFLQNYIIRQGFRDGTHGAVMAFMMSFHSFLVKGKLYMLYRNVDEAYR